MFGRNPLHHGDFRREHGRRANRPFKALGILPFYDIQVNSTSWAESGTSGHSNGTKAAC